MFFKKLILLILIICLVPNAYAVYGEEKSEKEKSVTKLDNLTQAPQERLVILYYFNSIMFDQNPLLEAEETIFPVYRVLPKSSVENDIRKTIELLIKGELTAEEKKLGFVTEFPNPDFFLVNLKLEDGTLILQFTEVFGFTSGGSFKMRMRLAQIERTVQQFPEVNEIWVLPVTIFQP